MKTGVIIFGYLKWHYSKALRSLGGVWRNLLYFVWEFFSVRLLFKSFFDPWKRMSDNYPKSFDLKKYFYTFLTNLIVRVVGMIMRFFLIIIGLASFSILALLFPFAFILWLFLPLIVFGLFLLGLTLLIK